MKDDRERQQVVYDLIKIQIQFGAYCYGDTLPTLEQAAGSFLVSPDTARAAYLRLQREGYITLSPNVGSTVIKDYSRQENEHYIRVFFSSRKRALPDLGKSLRPLLAHAQWTGLKNTPAGQYGRMQQLNEPYSLQPFIAFEHVMQAYASLHNDLLLRLLWQIFMFYEAPFFCIPDNPWRTYALEDYASRSFAFCLRKDWASLRELIDDAQDSLSYALCRFYEEKIPGSLTQEEIAFTWSPYKKASQICYSLAMDLLTAISRGQYPANTLLPSLTKLAEERNVSVSTVRRALSLLHGVGAVKPLNRIGTKVLPFQEAAENCSFTSPAVRRRLLDMAQSLQILTLSCRAVSEITLSALNTSDLQQCMEQLCMLDKRGQYELITYSLLKIPERFAPYQAIRTVYTQLLQQLFWGYPLRCMWKEGRDRMQYYRSCLDTFLRLLGKEDAIRFSERLEELLIQEFHFTIGNLAALGIAEAEELRLCPED